jgi:hypothetical protein
MANLAARCVRRSTLEVLVLEVLVLEDLVLEDLVIEDSALGSSGTFPSRAAGATLPQLPKMRKMGLARRGFTCPRGGEVDTGEAVKPALR